MSEEPENTTMRDALEAAYNEAQEPAEEAVENAPEPVEAAPEEGPARDEHGRFAPKEPEGEPAPVHAESEPAPDAGQPAPEAPPAEPDPLERAPQSWKPAAREAWAQLPPEARAEVYRREQEVQQAFQHTAEERKLAQAFHQVYAPYEAMIRGEGSDPLRATEELLKTAYQLRTAQPAQKAQLVAGLIQQFGVDIQRLDGVLSGQMQGMPQQPSPQQRPPQGDPRVDQIMGALQNMHQQNAERRQQAADAELAQFAQSHEFLDDVRDVMADLIEMSANRGVDLSLEDAYNQACKLNPEIASVMEQRSKAQAAGQKTGRARRAASSIAGSPAGAPPNANTAPSLREALEEAMDNAG